MRIFVYIGSNRGKKSSTKRLADKLIKKVKELYDGEVSYEIFTSADVKIKECQGCNKCFYEGYCPMDKVDDMKELKSKMLEADVIVWGSPSYAHNISSAMKKVIDRLSYWLHHMAFVGKFGISLCSSTGTGNGQVNGYLKKMFDNYGANYIGSIDDLCGYTDRISEDEDEMIEKTAVELVKRYKDALNGELILYEESDLMFEHLKKKYYQYEEYKDQVFEVGKWIEEYPNRNLGYKDYFISRIKK